MNLKRYRLTHSYQTGVVLHYLEFVYDVNTSVICCALDVLSQNTRFGHYSRESSIPHFVGLTLAEAGIHHGGPIGATLDL